MYYRLFIHYLNNRNSFLHIRFGNISIYSDLFYHFALWDFNNLVIVIILTFFID